MANANEQRDRRIYADTAQVLIREARSLYAQQEMEVRLEETVCALDSTVIDLCLSLFPWAPLEPGSFYISILTNDFTLPALTVAQLYKSRWNVELFFRWIKQHLRVKRFYGTSPNAVKTQLWVAVIVYLLVAILKKRLGLQLSLYTILQILSVTLFEKMPISQALEGADDQLSPSDPSNQLRLFH